MSTLTALHSEPIRKAVLQGGAGKRALDRMMVAYHSGDVEIDLSARGQTLLAGTLESELLIDGASQVPRGDWQAVCRHGDDDCDYLELQLCLNGSGRIERQLLLSRHGHFAFFADAIVAPGAKRIEYHLRLPPAPGVSMRFASATRECRLDAAGSFARMFPVALPQDRIHSTAGRFFEQNGRLELMQVGAGGGLFVPVIFDWHPRRRALAADWRSLTVTELGQVVRSDRASGHRLRVGRHQLLIYRSLENTDEARAVLGHHTRYETVVGSFDADGAVDPIVLVERD